MTIDEKQMMAIYPLNLNDYIERLSALLAEKLRAEGWELRDGLGYFEYKRGSKPNKAGQMTMPDSWLVLYPDLLEYTDEGAVFQIGHVQILMDTVIPYNWFKDIRNWYWTGDYMTLQEAEKFASEYNARVEDAYYSDHDEKQLMFDDIDDLLRWVFENQKERLEA